MTLSPVDAMSQADTDNFTVNTAVTPPETILGDRPDDDSFHDVATHSTSSVPWPGSTFIIRAKSSGKVLTLQDGQVFLAPPGGRGSIHWACVDTKGWLGFRNVASGRFLGHDKHGKLCCCAERHNPWENFCVRGRPEGGYVLLMTHFERLWYVGVTRERGVEKLAKIGNGEVDGIVWEFVKVQ